MQVYYDSGAFACFPVIYFIFLLVCPCLYSSRSCTCRNCPSLVAWTNHPLLFCSVNSTSCTLLCGVRWLPCRISALLTGLSTVNTALGKLLTWSWLWVPSASMQVKLWNAGVVTNYKMVWGRAEIFFHEKVATSPFWSTKTKESHWLAVILETLTSFQNPMV